MEIDLRGATYERFVEVVFDHAPEEEVDKKWFWREDPVLRINSEEFVAQLTMVCSDPGSVGGRLTDEQFCEGLEFIFCGPGSSERLGQLWNAQVPWQDRRRLILSIPNIYRMRFEESAGAPCGFMLWDWITYDYQSGTRDPARSTEDARVQDTMFEALSGMLASTNPATQAAAIHGLGHLRHRKSAVAINQFLESHQTITPEVEKYARDVLSGEFL